MRQTWGRVLVAVLIVTGLVVSLLPISDVYAAQLTNRKLELIGVGNDGGSKPAGTVNHRFTFDVPTGTTLGSIKFEYCTKASVEACVAPTDINVAGATFGSEAGSEITGFSMGAKTANSFVLTRTAAAPTAGDTAVLQANSILNPSPENYTFFTRITTYATTNASGAPTDSGSVAASTARAIQLTGTMPESLIFCTGGNIDLNGGGIPDCTTATAGSITFNQLFSPTDTATAISEMAASTNAAGGYVITVNGATMTSGANTIPALASAATAASTRGTSRFGLNLKLNTTASSTVAVGAEVTPTANGTDLKGQAVTGYDTVDTFKFVSGDPVARSDNGGAGPTNSQIYTASYIVNVAGSQPAGTYNTTLTYICTPTF